MSKVQNFNLYGNLPGTCLIIKSYRQYLNHGRYRRQDRKKIWYLRLPCQQQNLDYCHQKDPKLSSKTKNPA